MKLNPTIYRWNWIIYSLTAMLLWVILSGMILIRIPPPIDSTPATLAPDHTKPDTTSTSNIRGESLLRHPAQIPAVFWSATTDLVKTPANADDWVWAILGIGLIGLPAFALYAALRWLAWPNGMPDRKTRIITACAYLSAITAWVVYGNLIHPLPDVKRPLDLIEQQDPDQKSKDLKADITAMWGVNDPKPDREWVTATDEAIWAAVRVFNTVDLTGLKVEELESLLRVDLRSAKYGYQFPFWPTSDHTYTLRFDNGCWGWQFDMILDTEERVIEVKRQHIY